MRVEPSDLENVSLESRSYFNPGAVQLRLHLDNIFFGPVLL